MQVGDTEAGGGECLETEMRQQPRRPGVPRVRKQQRFGALMQGLESGRFGGLIGHGPSLARASAISQMHVPDAIHQQY
ncbi:hypothetical protein LUX33_20035 [Actinomadura madurae]|nr:hypothetical protein [Actinomadura madurae]MCP9967250.1 hypothetical protein [Actinomadura madurae]MCP9979708.1 hypothetical protein [Actinomadura madurae]